MQQDSIAEWQHPHRFTIDTERGERRTWLVILLTATMMVIEVAAGYLFGSMALLADGWHMGTHVAALSITAFVYIYARRHRDDPRFTFGTGKMGALGGFASAVALALVALMIGIESLERVFSRTEISLDQALVVAGIGLAVNLLSALLLGGHDHGHVMGHVHGGHENAGHPHGEGHRHTRGAHAHGDHEHSHAEHAQSHEAGSHPGGEDHNLRSAYFHVLADALTSLLAIGALLAAKYFGWLWMDTAMGFVGALVISMWAYGLIKDTSKVLLDESAHEELTNSIRAALERDGVSKVSDLHVWRVGPVHWSATIAVVSDQPKPATHYKGLIADLGLAHLILEVNAAQEALPQSAVFTASAPLT